MGDSGLATAVGRLATTITSRYPLGDLLSIRLPLGVLLALPVLAPMLLPSSRLLSLAVTATIYVIVANGLHVIFSYAGQLSLAQTTLWGLGAYTAVLLTVNFDWPTAALLPAAGACAALGAVAIGIPAFRTAGFSFAIITFAFAEIMRLIANNWRSLTNGNTGIIVPTPPSSLGPLQFDTFDHLANFYYLALAFAYLSLVGLLIIRQSSLGRALIAIRENEALARSLGTNVYLYKLTAFAISGLYAGVAGVFFMYQQKHVQPDLFTAFATIQFLLMILIGGRFSMLGPIIGAVIVVFGPEIINAVFGDVLNFTRIQILFGVLLASAVLTAPKGVAGQAKQQFQIAARMIRHYWQRRGGVVVSPVAPTEAQDQGRNPLADKGE